MADILQHFTYTGPKDHGILSNRSVVRFPVISAFRAM